MQERRATIRHAHQCPVTYCPTEDLLARDGLLMNLSERGAGLRLHETHQPEERVAVSVPLPGADEPVTLTGSVRWSEPPARLRRWYAVGVEWLPPEASVLERVRSFLHTLGPPSASQAATKRSPMVRAMLQGTIVAGIIVGVLLVTLYLSWVRALQWENRQLVSDVRKRDVVIANLEQDGVRLQHELASAKSDLAVTASAVSQLDTRAKQLTGDIQQLNTAVDHVQQSYLQVRQERGRLMERVMQLEQERARLASRLASVPVLRLAIRDAVEARRQAQAEQRRRLLQLQQAADRRRLAQGNRGYLLRDGRPTASPSTVWIHVHQPEEQILQAR